MARHMGWVLALLLLLPTMGRAAGPRDGSFCEKGQSDRPHGGQPPGTPHKDDQRGEPAQDRPGPPKWWIDAKLRSELGVTDQQSTAVEQIWQKSLPGLRDARERLGKLEDTLSKMTADMSDEIAVIAQIERRLAAGHFTMMDLLADVRLRVVAADDIARFGDPHRLLANVNTPAEHESLEALHNHEL